MRLRLLGTGASAGWPNPWCTCASCGAASRAGVIRGQTSALVDDRLLLDLGPDGPRAAARAGVGLDTVEAVLVGHAHPDHHAPPAWMWRGWAPNRRPLTLVAPPGVLAQARERLDETVTPVPVHAGDRVTAAGFDVRVLAATHGDESLGPAVLYDVTCPDGARLLWGVDTGVLPRETVEAVADAAFDVVLLELTSGGLAAHLNLRTWPEQVAALRRAGAVTAASHLLAVHLGHDNPPPDELDAVLAGWGARAPRDGEVLELGGSPPPPVPPARVLVLGGARSGKSGHAERLLAAEPAVTYVATAPPRPDDEEWAARVRAHRERRPAGWTTLETGDVTGVLRSATGAVLVDDLGLWLTRLLDDAAAWNHPARAAAALDAALPPLVQAWAASRRAVLVAPEVGGGLVAPTLGGRVFVDLLGSATAALAAASDSVVQVVAGLPRALR